MRALARLALVLPLLVAACDDAPGRSWLVERTRVLGARVSADREPARASIAPGETARIEWLIASPAAPPRLSWSFVACVAPEGNYAAPRCERAIATGSGIAETTPVVITLPVPAALAEGGANAPKELLVLAAFCASESTSLDAATFTATCPAGGESLLATAGVRLASAGPNANPEIAPDAVAMDDVVLPAAAQRASGAACEPSLETPIVAADGRERRLRLRLGGAEREVGESLALSHVVTGGGLDRLRSSLDPQEATPHDVIVTWTPPSRDEVGAQGRVVEMFFVLRDGRGGTGYARRAVCVR